MVWRILKIPKSKTVHDQKLIRAIQNIAGFTPSNLALYKLATVHSSVAKETEQGFKESNERLEYLGDAILGAAVADFLFKKFPFKPEGFLTEIRSRIVNREALNQLAKKIGVANIVQFDNKNAHLQQVILGNTLEAIVGAIYLDKGYLRTRKFVIDKLIAPNYDLEELVNSNSNFKSKIIEWAQREGKEVKFEIVDVKKAKNHKEFTAQVVVDSQAMGTGYGNSKKKAEQDAAFKTCELLNLLTA
ncbi:ribonuclease III [Chryseosolibacter indicus]|uniref:Ribonuclease 3 n=1 Tax=Chryseosolibacter indicus TaxID=2782351 RepID=A0ABS5VVM2_9BACT|nr:ribonuclease III [Chryseosolibacter indicus]MBT1705483.1 ribonuclease III [Chryseosolibacter indicus]